MGNASSNRFYEVIVTKRMLVLAPNDVQAEALAEEWETDEEPSAIVAQRVTEVTPYIQRLAEKESCVWHAGEHDITVAEALAQVGLGEDDDEGDDSDGEDDGDDEDEEDDDDGEDDEEGEEGEDA